MSILASWGVVRPLDALLDRPRLQNHPSRNHSVTASNGHGSNIKSGQLLRKSSAADAQLVVHDISFLDNNGSKRRSHLYLTSTEFLRRENVNALHEAHDFSFKDQGHLQFYGAGGARCGKTEKEGKQSKKASRRSGKRSAAKGLVVETEILQDHPTEAAVDTAESTDEKALLQKVLKELQKVTIELKAIKKAQEKAARCDSSSSSSSSSESSGSDMEVEDMRKSRASAKNRAPMQAGGGMPKQVVSSASGFPEPDALAAELRAFVEKGSIHPAGSSLPAAFGAGAVQSIAAISGQEPTSMVANRGGSVEVCMSGKCRRDHGAQQLLAAFQSRTPEGLSISASSCKCLGKCGKGANVRVRPDETNPTVLSYVEPQDVQAVLARHFGVAPSARPLPTLKPLPQVTAARV